MKVLDLFSGIGGFSLGLDRAGMETVAFCEIEEYPRKILTKHWPDVPIFNDIRKLNKKALNEQKIGSIDVICGGFPCQPFSVTGKQRGKEDDRHLWPEMLRLIQEIRPAWVIGENVAGFIAMALDNVLSDLEGEGYACQTFVIPACAVGGIHRRDRVWIVAHTEHNGISTSEKPGGEGKTIFNDKKRQNKTGKFKGICPSADVANSNSKRLQGIPIPGINEIKRKKPTYKQSVRCSSSQQFRPIEPPTQPTVRTRNDGLPDNMARLKALGNAVVPQIPEIIGRAIAGFEE